MANKPKPITSVYLDIADFVWTTEEVLLQGEAATVRWLRDLRACLATRDSSRSEYGAKLIESAESFREDARLRKAESRMRTNERAEQTIEAQKSEQANEQMKKATFAPPFVYDVIQFAIESNLQKDSANEFCDYYESKGWKVGSVKMKDWRAAFRNWVRREVSIPPASDVQTFCAEKGIDATKARDFYRELTSVGWKYRGQKIVDWKPLFLSLRG